MMSLGSDSQALLLEEEDEASDAWADEEPPFLSSLYYRGGATLGGGGAVGVHGPYGRARRRYVAAAKASHNTHRRRRRNGAAAPPRAAAVKANIADSLTPVSSALHKDTLQPLIKVAFESPYKEVRRDAAEAFVSLCQHPSVGQDGSVPMRATLDALLQLAAVTNPHNDMVVISRAATALASLMAVPAIAKRLAESPEGVPQCLQLIRLRNGEVNLCGIRILFRMARLPTAPPTIIDAGGMKALHSVINHADKRVRKLALCVAVKLAASMLQADRIGDTSTPFRTLELFTSATHPRERVGVLALLVQLAAFPDARPRLVAAGIVDSLAKLLTSATTASVGSMVMLCLHRLSKTPEVQAHIIQSPVVPLLLRLLFGDDTGSEDPIPKETTAGRLTVVAPTAPTRPAPREQHRKWHPRGSRRHGGRRREPVGQDSRHDSPHKSHAPGIPLPPTQFRHILTRAGAVMGGSTTSMGHDIPLDAPDPASIEILRPSSARSRPTSSRGRPSSRSRRSQASRSPSPRPSSSLSRPRSARASSRPSSPASVARMRPSSRASHGPSRPSSALSRPARPSSAMSYPGEEGTDDGVDRRVQFFETHPLERPSTAASAASSTAALTASRRVVIGATDGFQGALPELAPTAAALQLLLDERRKSAAPTAASLEHTPQATPRPPAARTRVDPSQGVARSGRRLLGASPRPSVAVSGAAAGSKVTFTVSPVKTTASRHGTSFKSMGSPKGTMASISAAPPVSAHVRGTLAPASSHGSRSGGRGHRRGDGRGNTRGRGRRSSRWRRGSGTAATDAGQSRKSRKERQRRGGNRKRGTGKDGGGKRKRRGNRDDEMEVSLSDALSAFEEATAGEQLARIVDIVVAAARVASGGAPAEFPRPTTHNDVTEARKRARRGVVVPKYPYGSRDVIQACLDHVILGNTVPPQLQVVRSSFAMLSRLAQCAAMRDHLSTQTALFACLFQPHIVFSRDKRIRRHTATTLEALCSRDGNSTWRHQLMYRYGLVPALSGMLSGPDRRCQEAAVRIIHFVSRTVSLQAELCVAPVLEFLFPMAISSDPSIQTAIVDTMGEFAGRGDLHSVLLQCGVVHAALLLLRPNADDAHMRAMNVLHALSHSEEACHEMVVSGRLSYCIRLERRGAPELRVVAAQVLARASVHQAAKRIQDMARRRFARQGKVFTSFRVRGSEGVEAAADRATGKPPRHKRKTAAAAAASRRRLQRAQTDVAVIRRATRAQSSRRQPFASTRIADSSSSDSSDDEPVQAVTADTLWL